jgi:hypothetical protein
MRACGPNSRIMIRCRDEQNAIVAAVLVAVLTWVYWERSNNGRYRVFTVPQGFGVVDTRTGTVFFPGGQEGKLTKRFER